MPTAGGRIRLAGPIPSPQRRATIKLRVPPLEWLLVSSGEMGRADRGLVREALDLRLLKSGTRIERRPRRATDALVRRWAFEAIAPGKLFSLAREPLRERGPGKAATISSQ